MNATASLAIVHQGPTKSVRCGCCGESMDIQEGAHHVATCPCGGLDMSLPTRAQVDVFVKIAEPMLDQAGPRGMGYFFFKTDDGHHGHGWYDLATCRVVQWG